MGRRRQGVRGWVAAVWVVGAVSAVAAAGGGRGAIKSQDLKEWLTYISSDELQGRAVFTAGFGLAAAYVEEHLRGWGVKPAGDHGSYLQTVRVLGVKATSHSTVTVDVNGETRTFSDGDAITFPGIWAGSSASPSTTSSLRDTVFDAPGAGHADFRGRDVKGAAVVWLG